MNGLHLVGRAKFQCPLRRLHRMAEQELLAFFNAVTQLFGSEQAELAGEDGLRELIESDGLPTSWREWRWLMAKVSDRLTSRVNPLPLSTAFTNS